MNKRTISVIIPTLGREKEPIAVVRQLLIQTFLPDEIIIIDQNTPRLKSLDDYLLSCGSRVKHFHFEEPGVCLNYNRGIEKASSEILLFLDDDIEIKNDLVEKHLKNYENINAVGGVAGGVLQPSGDLSPDQIKAVGKYFYLTGKVSAHFNYHKKCEVDFAPGGNMSYQKKLLDQIGGCDLNFSGNGYFFEPDLGLRVRALGYQIIFDPETMVRHLMAPRGGARIQDKAIHTYFFIKNGLLLTKKHSSFFVYFISWWRSFFYINAKALYNFNLKILILGWQALLRL